MANLNQIEVDEVTYDIEDNATRTASRVLVSDSDGKITVSDVTASELNLLDGATSDNLHKITAGTSDLTAGTSELTTGEIYCVYEA